MKKITFLCLMALLPLSIYADKVTVNVETEGTLEEVITNQEVLKITELVVTGRITAEDIIYLRENIGKGRITNLETLDLKDVTLVASETPYINSTYVECYLSDEERYLDESRNSSISGGGFWMEGRDYTFTFYYGKNLAYAFQGIPLKKVVLPSSVNKIGACCFSMSSVEIVEASGNITEIEGKAFYDCYNLVSIPSTSFVTKIGYAAFDHCKNLTKLDLSKVELLGDGAFFSCTSLATVGSLSKVNQMGKEVFKDCKALEGDIDLSALSEVPASAFEGCEKIAGLTFSTTLKEIGKKAFYGCNALTELTLPEGLFTIAASAFEDCKLLANVTIPSTLANIDFTSFDGTPWLKNYAIDDDGMMCINNVAIRYFIDTDFVANSVLTFKEGIIGIANGFQINWRNPQDHSNVVSTENITALELPSTLQFIGDMAFGYRYYDVKGYSTGATSGCILTGLTKLVFPASLKKIGNYAFPSTIKDITFSEGLEEIGKEAFCNCSKLEELKLPSTLKRIGENAFGNCTGLSEITIPENVENLNYGCVSQYTDGDGAFSGCTGVVIVRLNAKKLLKEVHYVHDLWGDIYNANILGKLEGLEKVIIGSEVEVLPAGLIYYSAPKSIEFEERPKDSKLYVGGDWTSFDNITSLIYPNCKLSFGEMRLLASRYKNVNEVQVLGEIEELGARAFEGCPLVGIVRLADGMTEIPDNAFADCSKLTSISIPSTVTAIGERAFYNCTSLACDIVIPDEVTTIGEYAFNNTSITSVTFGNAVEEVGNDAFRGCSSLSSLTFDKKIPNFHGYAFDGTDINTVYISDLSIWCNSGHYRYSQDNPMHLFLNGKEVIDLVIPDGTSSIGVNAFSNCEGITSVSIPNSVTTIGQTSFYNCVNLASIIIPNSVTRIGWNAFYNCYHLKSVTIPNSITSIDEKAFSGCSLDTVYCKIKEPLATIPFNNYSNTILYVPVGSRDLYMATAWSGFKVIYEGDGSAPDDAIVFEDPNIKDACIDPRSNIDINHDGYLSQEEAASVTNLEDLIYVTDICKSDIYKPLTKFDEFRYFTSVKDIPENAFNGWEKLTSITLPDGVKTIGNRAFYGCKALTSINLPDGLVEIGDCSFGYCTSLTKIVVPSSVTTMGKSVFDCCKSIESAVFEGEVVSFGSSISTIDMGLTSVKFGNKVKTIDEYAFYGCKKLTEVVIPGNVTTIGGCAFKECSGMTTLMIGKNVTSIGNSAFSDCIGLTSITSYIEEPFNIEMLTFSSDYNATLYVPAGTVNKYKAKKYWNNFTNIVEMEEIETEGLKDGDTFEATVDKTTFRFKVLSAADKTCQIGADGRGDAFVSGGKDWDGVIPSKVTGSDGLEYEVIGVGNRAFFEFDGIKSITLPASTYVILSEGAFMRCHNLTNVIVPEGVSVLDIKELAFNGCFERGTINEASLELPSTLTSISKEDEGSPFNNMALRKVVSKSENPVSISKDMFTDDHYTNATLYVPVGKVDVYKATDGWKEFGNIIEIGADNHEETVEVPIKISAAKQVPYCSEKDLDFTEMTDLKAYVATGYDKATGTIWLTRVKQVPANTGFLLVGDAGDYDIPVAESAADCYYKNMFKGTISGETIYTTDGKYTNYYLSNGDKGVGFYKVTKEEGQSIGANRCYLPILTDIPAVGSEGNTVAIKVSAALQVPYYTSTSLDFTSMDAKGVKAYTATGYNYGTGTIWLSRVKKVPAKTGVLIMANEAGDYDVPTASVAATFENMFTGSETAQTIFTTETIEGVDYVNYYLSKGDYGVGFYKVTKEDGVSMGANRCYLQIPKREKASGARGETGSVWSDMIISEEGEDIIAIPLFADGTTGIDNNNREPITNNLWYNLQGQRVENPGKGLYIKNGKKIVVK